MSAEPTSLVRTDDVSALTNALIYLEAQSDVAPIDPHERAVALIGQLASRGYLLRHASSLPLQDLSPESLLATRRALNLATKDVAREAGVSAATVSAAENPKRRLRSRNVLAIASAIDRLGVGTSTKAETA